jgi:LysR family glycine cleavage system transcriptional activator
MSSPNLNNLRAFEAVARQKTLGAAAKELSVTPGAISQQISHLENTLQVKLFERHRRGLRLTEAGTRLHRPIEQAMGLIQQSIDNLKSSSTRISIALSPSLAEKWLVPRLSTLAEAHPEIALQILAAHSPEQTDAEFILHHGAAPSTAGREVDLLTPTPRVAVTGPALVARAPVIARESFFAQYMLIEDASQPWAKWMHQSGTAFQSLQVAQTALALDAAEAGTGIALVPAIMAKDALATGRLVKLKEFPPEPGFGLYLIRPANTPASMARRIVEDWIRSAV